ncbi:hypothetical protein BRADI_1g00322v3 [Brachypodium distachyon]|uniref:Uncharacterized protein n=1 Tax=Brachypodium distachyon TaxID=15368 RepID=A0A0Q3GN50_BRADI|nr:hypothetical protein BRADI_1g00322v3 [Brachypodium distachyon]
MGRRRKKRHNRVPQFRFCAGSFPKIKKFKKKSFPPFDSLGDLYDGHIAEGAYNFTSTSEPSQIGGEYEDEREVEEIQSDDDLHMLNQGENDDDVISINEVDVGERVDNEQRNKKKAASGPKKKPPKELKKPNKSDEMVGAVERYVKMKEKQAEDEKAESNVFTISKCISALHKMKDFSREERVKAYKVFKSVENREIFLTFSADDDESAILWLRSEMQELS